MTGWSDRKCQRASAGESKTQYMGEWRCDVSWTNGQLESWTHLFDFLIWIYFDVFGVGEEGMTHINILKIQSFNLILINLLWSSWPAVQPTSHTRGGMLA